MQGLWFAFSVKFSIPPDESYHYQLIDYYANRSLTDGPLITNQSPDSLRFGDIERNPSYLYHYIMSFPLEAVRAITDSQQVAIFTLRVINVLIIGASLFVLLKVLDLAGATKFLRNLTVFTVSATGMFVWLGAAISYDNLAFLFFVLFVYWTLRSIQKITYSGAALALSFGALTVLTKNSFIPIIIIITVSALVMILKKNRLKQISKNFWYSMQKNIKKPTVVLATLLVVLVSGLVSERYVGNIIYYGDVTPACDAVHSHEECLSNGLYVRSANQEKTFEEFKSMGGVLPFQPFDFSGSWLAAMYGRLYFYFGDKQMVPDTDAEKIAFIAALILLAGVAINKKRLIDNKEELILLIIALGYTGVLFLYNLNSYLHTGAKFGYQGRYLIPALPFIYYFVIKLGILLYKQAKKSIRIYVFSGFVLFYLAYILLHFPFLVFLRGTTDGWYTSNATNYNLNLQKAVEYLPGMRSISQRNTAQ